MAEEIQKVWDTEQEILDVFHTVCEEHHLRYSLAYGTLLGAVRHQGFIPWDDDIDIMMPREDYDKLKDIWNVSAPKGYLYQDQFSFSDYPNNFAKIVKDHTTFLQEEEEQNKKFHKGIFVDVFPGDHLAPNRFLQMVQYGACAVDLLFSRGYTSGHGGLIGLIEALLLKLPHKNYLKYQARAEKIIQAWNQRKDAPFIFPCTIQTCKIRYPANMFELCKLPFQGKEYYASKHYDEVLRGEYGNYMKLPPESERIWTHHPILIDFEHNYEELAMSEKIEQ